MRAHTRSAVGLVCLVSGVMGCGETAMDPPRRDSGADTAVQQNDVAVTPTSDVPVVPTDTAATPTDTATRPIVAVSGSIDTATTWTRGNVYRITGGAVFVNSVLTIESGTTIVGEMRDGTRIDGGPPRQEGAALVVTTNGRLMAEGTASAPIVFTSERRLSGGTPAPGDWGGIVLLGRAPTNNRGGAGGAVTPRAIEGLPNRDETKFGGDDAAHNCGTLRYVRIEYGGYIFGMNNELNGLTVGGCGSATTLEYIQVHRGLDDGIEFFGGNANLRYAVVTGTGDDSLDYDLGYTGNIQFFLAHQRNAQGEDRCMETSGNKDNASNMPKTSPTVYNLTCIGPGNSLAGSGISSANFNEGVEGIVRNSLFMSAPSQGLRVQDANSASPDTSPGLGVGLKIEKNLLFNIGASGTNYANVGQMPAAPNATATAALIAANHTGTDPMYPATVICGVVGTCTVGTTPSAFVPPVSSPLGTLEREPLPAGNTWFMTANYLGAIEPGATTLWYSGWTRFDP